MKLLKNSLLWPLLVGTVFVLLCAGCWRTKVSESSNLMNGGKLVVSQNDMAFSVDEVRKEPGEEVTFDFVNKLGEKLRFYLLKNNEDPIVVQHLKAQQGGVPKEYYLFQSADVEPGQKLKVTFKAPAIEGVYAFVGVGEIPRESLVGRLIVEKKKKQVPVEGEQDEKELADDSI